MKEKKQFFFLIVILIFGGILRFLFLPDNLSFLYDQGRDALIIKEIIDKGKLTLIGPATDIPGVFHGPLHYYLLLPGYFIFRGNPLGALSVYIFLNVIAIYFLFLLGKKIFTWKIGLLASLILASSYGSIAYSRWLSNPSIVPLFMILLVYSLYQVSEGKEKFLISLAACWAIIFHLEVVTAVFFLPTILFISFFLKIKIPQPRILVTSFLITFLILSSYPLFDLRHDLLMSKSAYQFLIKKSNLSFSFNPAVIPLFLEEFDFILTTRRFGLAIIIFLCSFIFLFSRLFTIKDIKEKRAIFILVLWLIGTPLALGFYHHTLHHHFLIGVGPAMILLVAYLLVFLLEKNSLFRLVGVIILLLLIINNLDFVRIALPENKFIKFYGAQQKVVLKNQKQVIDYIYRDAQGTKFRYEALGLPYFLNHAWEYLFWWYGLRQYGYLPEKEGVDLVYFIIEKNTVDPLFEKNWLIEKKKVVKFIKQEDVGVIMVIRAEKQS